MNGSPITHYVASLAFCLIVWAFPIHADCTVACDGGPPLWSKNRRSDVALFRVVKDQQVGYIDASGQTKLPPGFGSGFNDGEDFVEGLAPVRQGRRWGYVNTAGRMVIPPRFAWVTPFSEGRALVSLAEPGPPYNIGYIDRSGSLIAPPNLGYESQPFSEGLAAVESGRKFGFIDASAKIIIEPRFVWAGSFSEGVAKVIEDDECEVFEDLCECRDFKTYRFDPNRTLPPCHFSFIDKAGNAVLKGYQNAGRFSEGLAPIRTTTKWGFINHEGALVIPEQFQKARPFSEGLAAVSIEHKWGFTDKTGTIVIPPDFNRVEDFSEGVAVVCGTQRCTYIDKTGKDLFGRSFSRATSFVHGLAHVALGDSLRDEVGYINREGIVVYRGQGYR